MGKSKKSQSEFSLEGRFLGYIVEDGYKIKQLRLATAEGECLIKLSKEARAKLRRVLVPGDWVKVGGTKKADSETDFVTLKAYSVMPIVPTTLIKPEIRPSRSKENILVCQKSGCMKRGGKAVCQALETALSDRGLDDQVTIKGTGCMKNCGQGPNVIMPGKARYCKINAREIPGLVDKHFPDVEPIEKARELQSIA
jgi:(2Fe-2S) ferredoxin